MSATDFIVFDDRPSDPPFSERVWRCHSERAGKFLSVASTHIELVVSRIAGQTSVTLQVRKTRVTTVDCPADGEWLAIHFKSGTFLPQRPIATLIDGRDVTLPNAARRSFWLDGAKWEFDQAHLTRALKRLIGLTPAKIARGEAQLSFLYPRGPPAA